VGLWGVSYGGAHVLVTAAKFGTNISAVIANVSVLFPWPSPCASYKVGYAQLTLSYKSGTGNLC
jgi:pimeloyl-ACP methyl ester carboxylesterase